MRNKVLFTRALGIATETPDWPAFAAKRSCTVKRGAAIKSGKVRVLAKLWHLKNN
jgi:hypothetical protein